MNENPFADSDVYRKGAAPSLVESFGIVGLHDYRSISLSSPFSATVLIAQNGSGKTTLLGALDAFLRAQFSRLKNLQFREIRCKLRDVPSELILRREDVLSVVDASTNSEIAKIGRRYDLAPERLLTFLLEEYDRIRGDYSTLTEEPVFQAIFRTENYSEAVSVLDKARQVVFSHSPVAASIADQLKEVFRNIEIVYLPTYRRIELPLSGDMAEGKYVRRKRGRFKFGSSGLFPGDIQFGLSDISDRLAALNNSIVATSNRGYQQISADIINELIDGTIERENYDSDAIPTQADLHLFFSRLKEGRRVGPFHEVSVPKIEKIYSSGEIPTESNKFLRYFLGKLYSVITATAVIEQPVEHFIRSCNKYLSSRDLSADLPDPSVGTRDDNVDDKVLQLDRRTLEVFAQSVPSGRKISLEALSSGEKQMVSLFAKLFLYPKEKVVLIDEPELSLSLDWQRHILTDVISAPLCRQVIAITHSPFVFENALEPFARTLHLSLDTAYAPQLPLEEEAALDE